MPAPVAMMSRDIFVGQFVSAFRRVGHRLNDETHLHAVLKHAALDRTFGADQRKNAWPFRQVDKRLEVRRREPLRRKICDCMTVQLRSTADLDLFHISLAQARRADRHFRKDDRPAFPTPVAKQAGRGGGVSWNTKIARIENLHALTAKNQTPRCLFSARKPALKTRVRNCTPSSSFPGSVSNCEDHSPSVP